MHSGRTILGGISMIIGIDGGGTKTKVLATDRGLRPLAEALGGPSSIRTVPFPEAIGNIFAAFETCLRTAGDEPVEALFAGLGDVAGEEDGETVIRALRTHPRLAKTPMGVKNDVYNAHAGALEGNPGIALIVGTGSVAFGVDESGKSHRAGGYSYKEGDFGSAYGLGKQALSLLGKARDGRAEESPLTETLREHFGIRTFMDMVALYDRLHTERTEIASLAPFVTRFAAKGDPNALAILEFSTGELLQMIRAVDRSLSLSNREVGIIGSLGNADTPYRAMLLRKVAEFDPRYRVFPAKKDPVFGSCVLAEKLLK